MGDTGTGGRGGRKIVKLSPEVFAAPHFTSLLAVNGQSQTSLIAALFPCRLLNRIHLGHFVGRELKIEHLAGISKKA